MIRVDYSALQEKFQDRLVKVDSYFLNSTGMVVNQTQLGLGEYTILGIPAVIGMKQIRLLVVFTPKEVVFFSKFIGSLHMLTISFQKAGIKEPFRIPLRGNMEIIESVPDRENLALLTFKVKSISTELVEILGNFHVNMDSRKETWEQYKTEKILLTPAISDSLGYNNFSELVYLDKKVRVKIQGFSSDYAEFTQKTEADPSFPWQLKWYFRSGMIVTLGKLVVNETGNSGFQMEFHPAIVEKIEEFKFKLSLAKKQKN